MSYDPTLPTDLDYVRFVLGDTETTELLSDEQIEAILATNTRNGSIAFLAQGLAARYAQLPTSVSSSGKSVSWGSLRVEYWLSLVASGGVPGGGAAFSVAPNRTDGYATLAAESA